MHSARPPNFFIVGAPRCGTTTLYSWLRSRKGIFMPARKELHYFSADHVRTSYYRPVTIDSEAEYLRCFAGANGELLAGDCSPSYLAYPPAAERIRAFNSEARIIIIVRDPVERALSHYYMDVDKRIRTLPLRSYLHPAPGFDREYVEYVGNSLYADSVARYWSTFPKDQVLLVVAEDLWTDPEPIARTILEFVGVAPMGRLWHGHAENQAAIPRFAATGRFQRNPIVRRTAHALPDRTKRMLKRILLKPPVERQYEVSPDDRAYLASILAPDVARLSQMLDRDLGRVWRSTCRREHSLEN